MWTSASFFVQFFGLDVSSNHPDLNLAHIHNFFKQFKGFSKQYKLATDFWIIKKVTKKGGIGFKEER
jgi:hypothetical protein